MSLPERDDRFWSRAAAGAILLWLVAAAALMQPAVAGLYHDDGLYLLLAKSIAEGRGWHLVSIPGEPSTAGYPPLLPLLLAPVWRLAPAFPGNVVAFKAVLLLFGAAFLGLSFTACRRLLGLSRRAAFATLGFVIASTTYLSVAQWILSELPFGVFALASLIAGAKTIEASPERLRGAVAAGLLAAAATLTRSQGIVIVVALALAALFAGRVRSSLTMILAAGAPVAGWAVFVSRAADPARFPFDYYQSYGRLLAGSWSLLSAAPLSRLWTSSGAMFEALARLVAPGVVPARSAIATFLVVIGGTGVVALWRAGRKLAPIALTLFFGSVVFVAWPPTRYLVPIAPLAAGCVVAGGCALAQTVGRLRVARIASGLAIAGVFAANLVHLGSCLASFDRAALPAYLDLTNPAGRWATYLEAFAFIGRESRPGDVFATLEDPLFALYTGRQGYRYFVFRPETYVRDAPPDVGSADDVLARLAAGHPRYLVIGSDAEERYPGGLEVERIARSLLASGRLSGARRFRARDGAIEIFELGWPARPHVEPVAPGVEGAHG